jgi:urease accessory protein
MRRTALLAALIAGGHAEPALAHDAFGDLGPFYANLLHPLADPGQGLLIAAIAVLLAGQPLAAVRPAYAVLALAGAATVVLGALVPLDPPGLRTTGLLAAALGALSLLRLPLRPLAATLLAGAIAVPAGLAVDVPPSPRVPGLPLLGAALGLALAALLVWGFVDLARRRLGPVAGAVAGSWVAAVGILAAALPA